MALGGVTPGDGTIITAIAVLAISVQPRNTAEPRAGHLSPASPHQQLDEATRKGRAFARRRQPASRRLFAAFAIMSEIGVASDAGLIAPFTVKTLV